MPKTVSLPPTTQLQQLYHFAELGRITGNLLHELLNPLTAASLSLDNLETALKGTNTSSPEVTEHLERTKSSLRDLEAAVTTARNQITNPEHLSLFSVSEVLYQVQQHLQAPAHQLQVELQIMPHEFHLFGNQHKFQQIMWHLLANAIDAYRDSPRQHRKVVVSGERDDEWLILRVQDWGLGIPTEIQDQIFQPGFSTKNTHQGMGLGLSLTKDLLEKDFKGQIHFASRPDLGSTFIVLFPLRTPLSRS